MSAHQTLRPQTSQDPHPGWLAEWRICEAAWPTFEDNSPEYETAWAERERLGRLICNTHANTIAGVQAQYEWFRADFGYLFEDMVHEDFSEFFEVLSGGFERACSEPKPPASSCLKEERDRLDAKVGSLNYLSRALRIIADELEGYATKDPLLVTLRGAVVGISRAMDRELRT